MTLHELSQAYRKGDRWVCFTGSLWATGRTERDSRRNAGVAKDDPLNAGNCWQLVREITMRITREEPITRIDSMTFGQRWTDSQQKDFEMATIADFLLAADCVKKVIKS